MAECAKWNYFVLIVTNKRDQAETTNRVINAVTKKQIKLFWLATEPSRLVALRKEVIWRKQGARESSHITG